jgi:hypothetical protein
VTVPVRRLPDDAATAVTALDLVVGAVAVTATAVQATARALRLTSLLAAGARPLVGLGATWRRRVIEDLEVVLPQVVDAALRRAHPTELVRRHVDLDSLVAEVDLDAVAARLDVEAIVARVDLDAVASRLDIEAVLDRLNLTETVLSRVDLKVVVDAVLDQIDLPAIVEEVLDEIDLPEIIRDSTGTMASETVRSVRMQGVSADEAVSRAMDRLLLRRKPATGGAT